MFEEPILGEAHRIFTTSKGCETVTAPQAANPPAMKPLSDSQVGNIRKSREVRTLQSLTWSMYFIKVMPGHMR